jgi:hypothetical protein
MQDVEYEAKDGWEPMGDVIVHHGITEKSKRSLSPVGWAAVCAGTTRTYTIVRVLIYALILYTL